MKKIITLMVIVAMTLSLSACKKKEQTALFLKEGKETVVMEYMTDELDTDPKNYLAEDTKPEVMEKVTCRLLTSKGEETDLTYLEVGDYILVFEYVEEGFENPSTAQVNVKVADTTAPVVEVDADSKVKADTDLLSLITMDADDYEVRIEGEVDFNKAGTYTIKYIVTDQSGNTTEIERNVTVDEKKPSTKPAGSSNKGGSQNTESGNSGGGDTGGSTSSEGYSEPASPNNPPSQPSGCSITASPGNSGKWFDSMAEASAWAEAYMAGANPEGWNGYGAGQVGGSCGKYTVNFYKSGEVDPMEGWTEACGILGCQ